MLNFGAAPIWFRDLQENAIETRKMERGIMAKYPKDLKTGITSSASSRMMWTTESYNTSPLALVHLFDAYMHLSIYIYNQMRPNILEWSSIQN